MDVCPNKRCRMVSYAMVCGADGFPTQRDPYSYYHAIRNFFLPHGKFSQKTRRHLQCDLRACGV